jgi:ubiquinone/menaquinone biosynthesis C-methylase UbiE
MRLETRLLLWLNAFFPRPNFPDRPTPAAYAEWEFHEAEFQMNLLRESGVRFDVPRALDLGCGLGGKTVYLAGQGPALLLGMDLSLPNIRAARDFARSRTAQNVRFSAADAGRLPLPDSALDLVVATDAFEHFPRPRQTLSEIARVLRPGGRLAVVFGPWGSPLGSHLYDRIFIPWCHTIFSRDTLAEALRELARRRARGLAPVAAEAELAQAEEQIRYFDHDINRMTLARFSKLLKGEPRLRTLAWTQHTPRKLQSLQPLMALPGLDEYLTGLLLVAAERVG